MFLAQAKPQAKPSHSVCDTADSVLLCQRFILQTPSDRGSNKASLRVLNLNLLPPRLEGRGPVGLAAAHRRVGLEAIPRPTCSQALCSAPAGLCLPGSHGGMATVQGEAGQGCGKLCKGEQAI